MSSPTENVEKIKTGNFFNTFSENLQKMSAFITHKSIAKNINDLQDKISTILNQIKGCESFDSTYILQILRYIKQINFFVETIETKAIKNGISTLFYERENSTFGERLQSIYNKLEEILGAENIKDYKEILGSKTIIDSDNECSIIKLEALLNKLQKNIIKHLDTDVKNYPDESKIYSIVEIINAFYFIEPENKYADDVILLDDCFMKIKPFETKTNKIEAKKVQTNDNWEIIRAFLVKIFEEMSFCQILFATKKAREKSKSLDTLKIQIFSNDYSS